MATTCGSAASLSLGRQTQRATCILLLTSLFVSTSSMNTDEAGASASVTGMLPAFTTAFGPLDLGAGIPLHAASSLFLDKHVMDSRHVKITKLSLSTKCSSWSEASQTLISQLNSAISSLLESLYTPVSVNPAGVPVARKLLFDGSILIGKSATTDAGALFTPDGFP